jgi:transposase
MGVCIGVDVSKDHLDWTWGDDGETCRAPNSTRGAARLVASLTKLSFSLVVVESTGGYERRLLETLDRHAIPVALVNPWRVRRRRQRIGIVVGGKSRLENACGEVRRDIQSLIQVLERRVVSRDVIFSALKGRLLFRTSGFWGLPPSRSRPAGQRVFVVLAACSSSRSR